MNRLKNCLDELSSLIYAADITLDTSKADRILSAAEEKALEYLDNFPDSAELNHMCGLIFYGFTEEDQFKKSKRHFLKAIELDADHQFARMYLGYYYFDIGDYQNAFETFRTIRENFFSGLGQVWRISKLHELILCCKVYLNHRELTAKGFFDFFHDYQALDEDDRNVLLEISKMMLVAKDSGVWKRINRSTIKSRLLAIVSSEDQLDQLAEYFV